MSVHPLAGKLAPQSILGRIQEEARAMVAKGSRKTSHFKRRSIPSDCVAKARNILDIPSLSRLPSQAPQRLK